MDIFTDTRSGLLFCIDTTDPGASDLINKGIPNYDLIKWCEQFVTSDSTFVDIGADMGTYSILLSKKCKSVYAFESNDRTFDLLNIGLCLNNCFNVKAYKDFLGISLELSKENSQSITTSDQNSSSNQIAKLLDSDDITNIHQTKLLDSYDITNIHQTKLLDSYDITNIHQTKLLDSYDITNISFMKISVPNELEVIKGAITTLILNNYPPFIFEVHNGEWYRSDNGSVLSYVKELGYTVRPVSGFDNTYLASNHTMRSQTQSQSSEIVEQKPVESNIDEWITKYESGKLIEVSQASWDIWHALAMFYRKTSGKQAQSYDCAIKGLRASPPVDKEYLLYEEVSIVAFYINRKDEGYRACDEVVLSPYAPWCTRNYTLNNQSFYMRRLPFKQILTLKFDQLENSSSILQIGSTPSIIPINNEEYRINLMTVNYSINETGTYIIRDPKDIVRNVSYLLTLDNNLLINNGVNLKDTSGLKLYPQNIRGFENVRLFGTNEMLCTYREVNSSHIHQICYCCYDPVTGEVNKIIPLIVGSELKDEEDWMPFIMDNDVYFIYKLSPLIIYKLDRNTGETKLFKEIKLTDLNFESFQGSSGLIPYKDGWLGICQQIYHNEPPKYFHRLIWFDMNFTQMKYSEVFFFESPDMEVNLSICHSSEGLLVPYSQKYNTSKIGVLNYEIIDSWLKF